MGTGVADIAVAKAAYDAAVVEGRGQVMELRGV
jgi:ornithine cyclodeaminase/alanine dehydrogenase-like protein (mu-crystallin family)